MDGMKMIKHLILMMVNGWGEDDKVFDLDAGWMNG